MTPSAAVAKSTTSAEASGRSTARIASLLPGLTDVLHDLKLSDRLVATSHECDHPTTAREVTRPKLHTAGLTPQEISSGWSALAVHPLCHALSTRICSFYTVDVEALRRLRPNIVITHLTPPRDLEPSQEQVVLALKSIIPGITVINTNPTCLKEVYQLYHDVGNHVGTSSVKCVANMRSKILSLSRLPAQNAPSVAVVQWTDPLYLAGDWVPEIISHWAHPHHLTSPGSPSVCVSPDALRKTDVVVFAICALDIDACSRVIQSFWSSNRNVFDNWRGRLICTDATRLFSRVALSVIVTSAEVLAEIVMDSDLFGHKGLLWAEWQPT